MHFYRAGASLSSNFHRFWLINSLQNRVSIGVVRPFSSDFEKAQQKLKLLKEEPDNEVKLKLYGLFKQASEGDVKGDRPKLMEFVKRAKFDAWKANEGVAREEAQRKYAEAVDELLAQAGVDPNAAEPKSQSAAAPTSGGNDGLCVSKQGKVFKIELNRPGKFNAITWEMYEQWISALNEANKDRETSVTVVTAVGDYYCAGNDLSNFTRNVTSPADLPKMADHGEQVLERFVRAHIEHDKPLIVLVNGPAIGISVTVMALCDLVIASSRASFHTPFSSLGQSPEGCSSYTFPMLMGTSKASEMLLFDKKLTVEEALERNLIARIIPHASFQEETERLVASLSELPPESLRLNKVLLRSVHKEALLAVNVRECALLKSRWLSSECQQALQKFMGRKTKG